MSPCIKKCKRNKDGICTGCFRTIEEIKSWRNLSAEEQKQIVNRVKKIEISKNRLKMK